MPGSNQTSATSASSWAGGKALAALRQHCPCRPTAPYCVAGCHGTGPDHPWRVQHGKWHRPLSTCPPSQLRTQAGSAHTPIERPSDHSRSRPASRAFHHADFDESHHLVAAGHKHVCHQQLWFRRLCRPRILRPFLPRRPRRPVKKNAAALSRANFCTPTRRPRPARWPWRPTASISPTVAATARCCWPGCRSGSSPSLRLAARSRYAGRAAAAFTECKPAPTRTKGDWHHHGPPTTNTTFTHSAHSHLFYPVQSLPIP